MLLVTRAQGHRWFYKHQLHQATYKLSGMRSLTPESPSTVSSRPEKRQRLEQKNQVASLETNVDRDQPIGPDKSDRMKIVGLTGRIRKKKQPVVEPYSSDDVLYHDVTALLQKSGKIIEEDNAWDAPLPIGTELEVVALDLSSTGDSISILSEPHPPWAVAVPFVLPGERARVRIYRNAKFVSFADLISVESPNEDLRDMSRVQCKYFGKCAGCQYQMLSYQDQLDFKQKVVDKAYVSFSNLPLELIPLALPTVASPLTYGYRTKITPHFDIPPKKSRKSDNATEKKWELRIGFGQKGRRAVMDIEECPIATPVLNKALGPIRKDVQSRIASYKRGATLLLRDSLVLPLKEATDGINTSASLDDASSEEHVCITDYHGLVRTRVGEFLFEYPAGSFFQNNDSILEPLTSYVRDAVLGTSTTLPTHLVDAYCGSGLFSITLSPHFSHVAGVEISKESIKYARHNAEINQMPTSKCTFHAGEAEAIFDSVTSFPPNQTVVIMDPPRKGCDMAFLKQLINFGPATVVYVSCNVHTQARDVGVILKETENRLDGRYQLESLRGFDLFPQTAHVESVAILRKCVS